MRLVAKFSSRLFSTAEVDLLERIRPPVSPSDSKRACVAIIGQPNAGKSTLVNQMCGEKLMPVSCKVHTTRRSMRGILTHGNCQVEFLDTPGLVPWKAARKYKLPRAILVDPRTAFEEADVIAVVVDATDDHRQRLHFMLKKMLFDYRSKPSVLIINKVDNLRNRSLLEIIDKLADGRIDGKSLGTSFKGNQGIVEVPHEFEKLQKSFKGWPLFETAFSVSGLKGSGVNDLVEYFLSKCKPGEWRYDPSFKSDLSKEEMAVNVVKGVVFERLHAEVPYRIKYAPEFFEVLPNGVLAISIILYVPSHNYVTLVNGSQDFRIDTITHKSANQLEELFKCPVNLNLSVRYSNRQYLQAFT